MERDTTQIELEDVSGTSLLAGTLATLGSQQGNAYLRFVAHVRGKAPYKSSTFAVPRTFGTMPPEEAWAPEMTRSLAELRRDLERDGWVQLSQGNRPWEGKYERRADTAASD